MCYFSEAWAWGPYLNGGMSAAAQPRAYVAAQRALALRDRETPVHRALIDAMALRYDASPGPETRVRLDSVYSDALEEVYQEYPTNLMVATIYAESLMLLNRSRGTYRLDDPFVQKIHQTLEAVLILDIRYPGACHLYIHGTEATSQPEKAEACADFLGNEIPGASHVNHMPSHAYNRIGRWGDAVRANIQAWHTDLRSEEGDAFAIYPTHNLHMMLFAAAYDGQGAIAIQAAKDYAKVNSNAPQFRGTTLVRFGRLDEVLELDVQTTSASSQGQLNFARGYAHLKVGSADSATYYLGEVDRAVADAGGNTARLLGVLSGILTGETHLMAGRTGEATAAFEAAVVTEDEMPYAEPETLPFSARHWLGAALLEARTVCRGRAGLPGRDGGPPEERLEFGLAQALDMQGRTAEAAQVRLELDDAWARSDTWLRGSKF